MVLLAVLVGGLVGSGLRSMVAATFETPVGGFPSATFAVNLVGAFALGLYLARRRGSVVGRLSLPFWAIGVLGSLTTFSTFSIEVVRLVDDGAPGVALAYVIVSLVGGLGCALVGDRLGRYRR
jgi:fluoride exporter